MRSSEQCLKLIQHFEGFRATAYHDAAGHLTIGYGHLIRTEEVLRFAAPITQAAAVQLLMVDIAVAERAVQRLIRVALTQSQFDALVSFTFNLGSGALERSRLRRVVNREDHAEVPQEFMRWVFAGGKKLPGLVRRRAAEAELYSASNG